jgi:hypothetical protein
VESKVRVRHRTRPKPETAPSDAAPTREIPSPATSGANDYEVGYKKPPRHTQFKPGRSGNPRGRPKGHKNFKTDLLEELQEAIAVREGGKRRTVTKQRAMLKTLTAKALQGDTKAAAVILNMVFRILHQGEEPEEQQDLSAEDRAILEAYENRIRNSATARRQAPQTDGERP